MVNIFLSQCVMSRGAVIRGFFGPVTDPFMWTLTIIQPAWTDTRHMSVHSARRAGENAAE